MAVPDAFEVMAPVVALIVAVVMVPLFVVVDMVPLLESEPVLVPPATLMLPFAFILTPLELVIKQFA